MPNNGFERKNRADTDIDNEKPRKTHYNGSDDDISDAKTEDLVAIFGQNIDTTKSDINGNNQKQHRTDSDKIKRNRNRHDYDDSLDSFDDEFKHRSNRHKKNSTYTNQNRQSRNSNSYWDDENSTEKNNDNISRHKNSQNQNRIEYRNANTKRNSSKIKESNKKHTRRTIAVIGLAVIAIVGVGYAAWNLTPLHSMIIGNNDSASTTNSSGMDAEAKGRKVKTEKLDFKFKHKGIQYTFTDLTSVAPSASKSANGRETFKVTLKAINETDEDYPMTSIGVNIFDPNGNYLADMVRNDTVLENENGIDAIEDPTISANGTYERTLEIPATKSGTYTLEIIDVGTDEIFRVPVNIKVEN